MSRMELSDDEERLVRLFRCAEPNERSEILADLASLLCDRYLPESLPMPAACGIEPKGWDSANDPESVAYVVAQGIDAAGGQEMLFHSSDGDEEHAVPSFAAAAQGAALEQGSFFDFDTTFAREYLREWRFAVVSAIEQASEAVSRARCRRIGRRRSR